MPTMGDFGYGRRRYRSGPVDYDNLNIGESYNDEIVIDGWKDASGKKCFARRFTV